MTPYIDEAGAMMAQTEAQLIDAFASVTADEFNKYVGVSPPIELKVNKADLAEVIGHKYARIVMTNRRWRSDGKFWLRCHAVPNVPVFEVDVDDIAGELLAAWKDIDPLMLCEKFMRGSDYV